MSIGDILLSTSLFSSKNDCMRLVNQKGVKLNGQLVTNMNEEIEIGDFINFLLLPEQGLTSGVSRLELVKEHGLCLLHVARGKSHALVKVKERIEVLA